MVALILARGGSRRVPRKNIRYFRGMPMLTYPIRHRAKASKLFDLIVVSTDDDEIADCAFRFGAVVVPRAYDDGTTGTQEVAARVLDQLDLHGGMTCVIYPCTPLLTPELLELGKQYLLRPEAKCFARAVGPDGADAGAFYWGWTRAFRDRKPLDAFNTIDVPLPAERVCDVDTPEDWARCEAMFDALKGNP
jgi:pseudaminic acid cytidylyltransferase